MVVSDSPSTTFVVIGYSEHFLEAGAVWGHIAHGLKPLSDT